MRNWFLNVLIAFLLIPAVILSAPVAGIFSSQEISAEADPLPSFDDEIFQYDDILALLTNIENGVLEREGEDPERINQILIFLARYGVLPNEDDENLLRDIEELEQKDDEYFFSLDRDSSYQIVTTGLSYGEIVLCKTWWHKRWDHTKHFVKEHKKEIIIGTAIVVGAAVTAGVIAAVAPGLVSTAMAALGTAAAAGIGNPSDSPNEYHPSSEITETATEPNLPAIVEDQIIAIKEMMANEGSLSSPGFTLSTKELEERIRLGAAGIAHDILNGISTLTSPIQHLNNEIGKIESLILPENKNIPSQPEIDPSTRNQITIADGHSAIDRLFGTNMAPRYIPDSQANHYHQWVISELPVPGNGGSKIASDIVKTISKKAPEAGNVFKALTSRNFRENLKRYTGKSPGQELDAHHILAQKHRDFFLNKGININDPKYGAWWDRHIHRSTAKAYNADWNKFRMEYPAATEEQILEYAKLLMSKYKKNP